ncbi:sodium/glutamate symporter [Nordella sp. HKS 07]|uniref:sodium/glutamate symporter n=1 Tax=Nordella sp. HKS 07 TaxID=2712222 RepID=UPI0013E1A5FF|nr:sodium/glutamate symporter [Nordella sp. HKS 07]QIG46825.1 sodium/glutamate symporter [Nordella sp. HKS 07]
MEAMTRFELDELSTLIVGVIALFVGRYIRQAVPFLRRIDMPNAVVGAMIVAVAVLLLQVFVDFDVVFGSRLKDALLLIFFTTIGLSAKLAALKSGGKPLLILCAVTVVALMVQNLSGAALATFWGVHPAYGVLVGSLSFVGGPGTAMAWAKELQSQGLQNAQVVAVGAATLAVIAGALVSGPVTGWIVKRHNLHGLKGAKTDVTFAAPPPAKASKAAETGQIESLLSTVFVLALAVLMGEKLNQYAREAGLLLPGFLSAMLAGVVITNVADILKHPLDFAPIEKGGAVALQLFLVMALMSTPLISVAVIIVPLMLNVVIQVVATVAIAYFVLFRLLGSDYDAAVTSGGFLGFGLSSMPVAMATMDEVGHRYGPSPKAFLLITLAGSFFVDLANAVVAKVFLALPYFSIAHPVAGG